MTDEARAGEPRPDWVHELSLVIAKARFGPGVTMDGRHNPRPSEVIAARRFLEVYEAAAAPALDVEMALRVMDKLIEIHDCRDPDVGVPCSFHAREHRQLADVVYEESRLSEKAP